MSEKKRRWPLIGIAALLLLGGGGYGVMKLGEGTDSFGKKTVTSAGTSTQTSTESLRTNSSVPPVTTIPGSPEVYITVREDRFFIDDKEYTKDNFPQYLATLNKNTLFIIRDDNAIKKSFEDVMKTVKDNGFQFKIMTENP